MHYKDQHFQIGPWQFATQSGELRGEGRRERLEPKSAALLCLFAEHPDQLLSRKQIIESVWADTIIGDDALARAVFKLRRALGDDPKEPRFIETIPKRGYRLIAPVAALTAPAESPAQQPVSRAATGWTRAAVVLAAVATTAILAWFAIDLLDRPAADPESSALVERAQDFYHRYSRPDNEAAIALYERILAREPDNVEALAGLSNALIQRLIRWPGQGTDTQFSSLSDALANGHLDYAAARRVSERAELLARRALHLDPDSALLHRSLGLVLGAQSRIDESIAAYRRAIELNPDAWGAMINLGEMLALAGDESESLDTFIDAFEAMTRRYEQDKQHILPWYDDLAVLIGDRMQQAGRIAESEGWYRRALGHTPLNPDATAALAGLLQSSGREVEAQQLCAELHTRVDAAAECPRPNTR